MSPQPSAFSCWLLAGSPGQEIVVGGCGEEGCRGGVGLRTIARALDGFGAGVPSLEQGFFCFAQDDDGGAAVAGSDGETCGEADGGRDGGMRGGEWGAEDFRANAFGEKDGVLGGAAGEPDEEFIFADAAEEVVTPQEAANAFRDLDEEMIAGCGAEMGVPVAEIVDVEEDAAERGVHALYAVGLAEKEREDCVAGVGAGQPVGAVGAVGARQGVAQGVEFAFALPGALNEVEAKG